MGKSSDICVLSSNKKMGVRLNFLFFFFSIGSVAPSPEGILLSGGHHPNVEGTALEEGRADHTSWQREQDILLMGGYVPYTSEIVHMGGEQGEASFAMEYDSKESCSMADMSSDSVFITGGYYTMDRVSRYDSMGFVEDLPSLIVGRYGHGCGSCMREDKTQVLIVAGGWDHNINLSSTEVLTSVSPSWTISTRLPRAMYGLRGVTVSNILYMTGGEDSTYRNEIIAWRDEEQKWEEMGKMRVARYYHAVTTIKLDDPAMEFCS